MVLEAAKSLSYSEQLVRNWLIERNLIKASDAESKIKAANEIASYFNAAQTSSDRQIHVHGQRIGPSRLVELDLRVKYLESCQAIQDEVLTAYHLMTLIFENSMSVKFIASHLEKLWMKNEQPIMMQQPVIGQ